MSEPTTENPRKRQRSTQACHRCRRKKYKCNSVRPVCSACSASNSECTYGLVVKRRGLQPGYVKAIEVLWGLVFRKVDGSQIVVRELLNKLSAILNSTSSDSNGGESADEYLEGWKTSGVPAAIELMLDGGFAQGRALEDVEDPGDLTLTSTLSWSLAHPDHQALSTSPSVPPRNPAQTVSRVPPSDATFAGNDANLDVLESRTNPGCAWTPLPPDWHDLTQVYLTVEHSWFPVLERHALFRIAYTYQGYCDSGSALNNQHQGEFASLWAVLALGEIHSNGASAARVSHFKSVSIQFLSRDPMQEHYHSHSQALLLWSIIHLGCNDLVLARLMLVQAVVLSSSDCSRTSSGEPRLGQQRSLTFSCCFVLDALLSLAMGTRPQIPADELRSHQPCDESGSDEWEIYVNKFGSDQTVGLSATSTLAAPTRTSSTFNHLVKLMCIINAALQRKMPTAMLAADIQAWEFNLPPHLKTDGTSVKSSLPPQLHLRAWYKAVSSAVVPEDLQDQLSAQLDHRGVPVEATILQIAQTFGAKTLPASVTVLIAIMSTQTSPGFVAFYNDPAIAQYRALWDWSEPDFDTNDLQLMSQDQIHLAPMHRITDLSHDASHPPRRDLSTIAEAESGDGQQRDSIRQQSEHMLVPEPATAESLDITRDDAVHLSVNDSPGISGLDALPLNTPEQLRDYLALLQDNERYINRELMINASSANAFSNENNQDFMQSLGFLGGFHYTDI